MLPDLTDGNMVLLSVVQGEDCQLFEEMIYSVIVDGVEVDEGEKGHEVGDHSVLVGGGWKDGKSDHDLVEDFESQLFMAFRKVLDKDLKLLEIEV